MAGTGEPHVLAIEKPTGMSDYNSRYLKANGNE
jgi:hypothetical protein